MYHDQIFFTFGSFIIDDDDYLSDDFVTLSGWGIQYNSTNRNYNPSSKLKLHTLQVFCE